MAELFCNMVLIYVMGKWSWVPRGTTKTYLRPCALPIGHVGAHRSTSLPEEGSSGPVVVPKPDPERDRRRAEYARIDRKAAADELDRWFRAVDEGGTGRIQLADLMQVLSDHRASAAGEGGWRPAADPHPGVPCWQIGPDCGHLHEDDGSPCHKIECHELGDEYCTWCGGRPCKFSKCANTECG